MRRKIENLENIVPKVQPGRFRVEMTAKCQDCDPIPKCQEAGQIILLDGKRVQILHNGLKVIADGYYGNEVTEIVSLLKGHHEPQEELAFHHVLRALPREATMLELGTYWSYYSLWLKQGYPTERRAIALEPIPEHLKIGRENARLNAIDIEFLNGSIGLESIDQVKLEQNGIDTIEVRQYTVPEIFELKKIDKLDLLHCDAQGAELDVILSSADLFRQDRIRFCFFSTHHHNISHDPLTHQRCLMAIKELGGHIIVEHDVNESYSGDGLIVAHFGGGIENLEEFEISYNRYSQALFRNPLYDFEESMYPINGLKSLFRHTFLKSLYMYGRSIVNLFR